MTERTDQTGGAALYLLPVPLSDIAPEATLPAANIALLRQIRHFIVENVRTARRFLKACDRSIDIDQLSFYELNTHTDPADVAAYLEPLRHGESMGLMSEAGCPAVADPGAAAVAVAQRLGLRVVPLVGPSSIIMGLMASGFNGQGFTFHGYLPIDEHARLARLRELEADTLRTSRTQIFIETPYRNNRMVDFLARNLRSTTLLCVASGITDPGREKIVTRPAAAWRSAKYDYSKTPTIFLIGKN